MNISYIVQQKAACALTRVLALSIHTHTHTPIFRNGCACVYSVPGILTFTRANSARRWGECALIAEQPPCPTPPDTQAAGADDGGVWREKVCDHNGTMHACIHMYTQRARLNTFALFTLGSPQSSTRRASRRRKLSTRTSEQK